MKTEMIRTNIEIDDKLIEEIKLHSKLKTKKNIVNKALKSYLNELKRRELASLAGKIAWEGDLESMRET
ncbi:type II toxin-antitoxin system VapB family antitoxin [Algoriphagus formosus]|uniref:Toxin-antitoxin system antidote component n=1 Tax=Algoriphagus marincola HL-49 TaxID=1305737 RepID=A0A0P7X0H8_9BACT|nr:MULTISPECIES: type II toxin-antitoxin system VapB family antitoxin [Algoriphagus]KPQ07521.1 MAG: toxin-antitoxin system antidote component [Algoriphagus marincola HL-49]